MILFWFGKLISASANPKERKNPTRLLENAKEQITSQQAIQQEKNHDVQEQPNKISYFNIVKRSCVEAHCKCIIAQAVAYR